MASVWPFVGLVCCFITSHGFYTFENKTDRVIVNLGCFEDPPIPFKSTAVIAFEARYDAAATIPAVPNRHVVSAAVGTTFDIVPISQYGPTSSMLRPQQPNITKHSRKFRRWLRTLWKNGKNSSRGRVMLVPLIPISFILQRILQNYVTIWFLKTGKYLHVHYYLSPFFSSNIACVQMSRVWILPS